MSATTKTIDAQIKLHAARAFFADAWSTQCEESDDAMMLSGAEIMSIMPDDIDPAASEAADTLEKRFLEKNPGVATLTHALAWLRVKCPEGGDRERTAEMFGHYLAMQYIGSGVGLRDAFGDDAAEVLRVPYGESVILDKEYFS